MQSVVLGSPVRETRPEDKVFTRTQGSKLAPCWLP